MKEKIEAKTFIVPDIVVFDMDGTLYQLDGDNGTFTNSTLFNTVILNSINFVIEKENCNRLFAEKLIEEAKKDEVGISNVLSKRYSMSRTDVFNRTWNIDAKTIIKNYEKPVMAINRLKMFGKQIFLLTSAPAVWMNNVVKTLSLENHFDRKISAEMFPDKSEVFRALASEFDPKMILSVGDQISTDIEPAKALGMRTFKVNGPEDLTKLI